MHTTNNLPTFAHGDCTGETPQLENRADLETWEPSYMQLARQSPYEAKPL
jgi:hypothetical protein